MSHVEWQISDGVIDYQTAVAAMEERVADIRAGIKPELIWLLEHPPLYTAGTSARDSDLIDPGRLPVFSSGRGGQYTYHGPGQRVVYVMVDLARRGNDVRCFVHDLEEWIIQTLKRFDLRGERRSGRVGIWIAQDGIREDKIAAIGIRVRRGVTYHGIAVNVDPDLKHFKGIIPCGIDSANLGVTSLVELGLPVTMADLDVALKATYETVFTAMQTRECEADFAPAMSDN